MNPAVKRFVKRYGPIYDTISRADIPQEDRELLAAAMGDAIAAGDPKSFPDFNRDSFVSIASDPMVHCAGYELDDGTHVPCPHDREFRIAMHNSDDPENRSAAWRPRLPEGIRCTPCGAMQFSPEYRRNVLAREAEERREAS